MSTEAPVAAGSTSAPLEALDTRAVIISLTAQDLPETITWYRDVLGFTVDYQTERDGKPSSAGIRSGCAKIFLNQDDGGRGWLAVAVRLVVDRESEDVAVPRDRSREVMRRQ